MINERNTNGAESNGDGTATLHLPDGQTVSLPLLVVRRHYYSFSTLHTEADQLISPSTLLVLVSVHPPHCNMHAMMPTDCFCN